MYLKGRYHLNKRMPDDLYQGITYFEQAYEERNGAIIYLYVIPIFYPLRSDPRFINLLKRIGFNIS